MSIDTRLEDSRWEAIELNCIADRVVEAVLGHLGMRCVDCEVDLLGCDDARILKLNATFRNKPRPTNVLSWPSEDRSARAPGLVPDLPEKSVIGDPEPLGDIAIAYDTCLREANEQDKSMSDHVTHLIVHAVLHLLGYDHIDDKDAALMERTEVEILGKLGIDNPY